jgi:hypothetical protein
MAGSSDDGGWDAARACAGWICKVEAAAARALSSILHLFLFFFFFFYSLFSSACNVLIWVL